MCYSFCFLSVEGGIKLIALSWQLKATLCPDCFLLQTCSLLLHGLCISVLWCSKPSLVPAWHAALPSSCLLSTQHLLPGSSPCPPDLSPVLCRPQHPFELPQASQGSSCVALPQPQHNSLITQSVLPCPGKSGVNGLKKQTVMEILAQGVFFSYQWSFHPGVTFLPLLPCPLLGPLNLAALLCQDTCGTQASKGWGQHTSWECHNKKLRTLFLTAYAEIILMLFLKLLETMHFLWARV